MTEILTLIALWACASLANATPLIFTTLGETLGQRAGVINLGCEGSMLAGACLGLAAASLAGDPWAGLAAGLAAGAALALLHAGLVLGARANQLASGIAVWLLALGLTSYAGRGFVGRQVEALPTLAGTPLADIPVLGRGLGQLSLAAPAAVAAVAIAALWLARTRSGLAWRVTGESAAVAGENGIAAGRIRLFAILCGGALAGLGGAVLSVDYTQTWAEDMTKGQGLVAVGLVIVARWRPILVLPVCLLFGLAETASLRLPLMGVELSSYLLSALPYATVLVVLVADRVLSARTAAMPGDLKAVFE